MKTHRSPWLFHMLLVVALVGLVAAPSQAAEAADGIHALTSAATGETVSAPWWSGAEAISAVIALCTGLIAVWQRNEKKTAQKVNESLVIAIEAATKIPAVAAQEKAIKAKIRTVTDDLGVAPLVHRLVKDLT